MPSKLFAFNLSKKIENVDEQADNQWVGDLIARASTLGYCTGQNYGLSLCQTIQGYCYLSGSSGYYLCDGHCPDSGC